MKKSVIQVLLFMTILVGNVYSQSTTSNSTSSSAEYSIDYVALKSDELNENVDEEFIDTVFLNINEPVGDPGMLYIPNAMSVGSAGKAGMFIPKGYNLKEYEISVYDNWGNMLWYSNALENGIPTEGWDGFHDGIQVENGVYFWSARAIFLDNSDWKGQLHKETFRTCGNLVILQ